MAARAVNVILGLLLFVSAFLWPHHPLQFHSAWLVGVLSVTMSILALSGFTWARYVNVAFGAWLLISALLGPRYSVATLWTHLLVGVGLALYGVAPSLRAVREREPVGP